MDKDTFFIMNKTWRLLLQENTPIYTKFSIALWANGRFTINLFSYVKIMQTISALPTMLTCMSTSSFE